MMSYRLQQLGSALVISAVLLFTLLGISQQKPIDSVVSTIANANSEKEEGSADSIAAEEYEVYAAALDNMVGSTSYVIIDTTSIHGDVKDLDRALAFPTEFDKFVTPDLVQDFTKKNKQRCKIGKHFPEKLNVTLLSEREEHDIFSDSAKDGWKVFREKYFSSGITRLSRVGFNKERDTATVYVGHVADWEIGRGAYLLLRKIEGKWQVIIHTRGWIS